ncbi:hypothetical protein HMPREF9944_01814 [Segatella maculosa OT 289]|uniref:Uncharacterized protein n=1 Tax=Segatella maculosa OT 289 TaxID=999422 RepID=H1HNS0_9BACT|nr:hypothetical protein HMPREF9944_01814 [Segatella maculosa OT 289]
MQGCKAHVSAQTAVYIRLAFTRNGRTNRASLPRHICHSHLKFQPYCKAKWLRLKKRVHAGDFALTCYNPA